MPIPQDFYAREGDWPPSRIAAFARFVLDDTKKTFQGVRVNRGLSGVTVIADPDPVDFIGAWPVTVFGLQSVRIGPGTVNGRVPWLDGRDLEGLDEEGEAHPDGVPTLSLSEGPGERRRSYVGVRVTIDAATGAMDPATRENLTVEHRPSLHAAFLEGGAPDEEGSGFWPLAQIQWSADGQRVERVRQWACFDYVHRYQAGAGTRPGRHWFRPG